MFHVHCRDVGYSFEAGGVTDHLVQSADNIGEAGSHVAVLLPAVEHQLVQSAGAVHGWWQTVVLLNGINHLGRKRRRIYVIRYTALMSISSHNQLLSLIVLFYKLDGCQCFIKHKIFT